MPGQDAASSLILHATTVALSDRGVLILGPSGSGKSSLALSLLALGCCLISDDQTLLRKDGTGLSASCPNPDLQGVIEARGIGLLKLSSQPSVTLSLVVDMGRAETERLPPQRCEQILQMPLPLVLGAQNPHLAQAILLLLRGGRLA